MKVIAGYYDKHKQKTIWGISDGGRVYETTAEYLMDEITDTIENTPEQYLYITDLSLYGMSILHDMFRVGYRPTTEHAAKKMRERDVSTMISDAGDVYAITVKRKKRTVRIVNADNLITLSSPIDIMDSWGTPGEYTAANYARAVHTAITGVMDGFQKRLPVTISGAARRKWKNTHDDYFLLKNWVRDCRYFEVNGMKAEKYFRPAYHGGLCLRNTDKLAEDGTYSDCGPGIVIDINSMYPYIMATMPMPYGEPHPFEGKPSAEILRLADKGNVYFFSRIRARFDLEPDGIPCVSVQGTPQGSMHPRGWLTTSRAYNKKTGEYLDKVIEYDGTVHECTVTLTLTMTDLKLFCENYDIHSIEYIDGVWFPATTSLFDGYVKKYWEAKKAATTPGTRRIAKIMLNSLSGNMARHPDLYNLLISYQEESDTIMTDVEKSEDVCESYVHIGAAITSYGRAWLISVIRRGNNRQHWLYSDTDSWHFDAGVDLDQFPISAEMGDVKIEKEFAHSFHYNLKTYALVYKDGSTHLTFAGVPQGSTRYIEDIINGEDPDKDPRADDITMTLDDFQAEAVEELFEGGIPADFDEIMEDASRPTLMYRAFAGDIEKYKKTGEVLARLPYITIPIVQKYSDGYSQKPRVLWSEARDVNKWA